MVYKYIIKSHQAAAKVPQTPPPLSHSRECLSVVLVRARLNIRWCLCSHDSLTIGRPDFVYTGVRTDLKIRHFLSFEMDWRGSCWASLIWGEGLLSVVITVFCDTRFNRYLTLYLFSPPPVVLSLSARA